MAYIVIGGVHWRTVRCGVQKLCPPPQELFIWIQFKIKTIALMDWL